MSSAVVIPIVRAIYSAPLPVRQLVEAVEGRGLVALGQRRIVENGIDEILHTAAKNHNCLADVKQLGSAFTDDVHAQHLFGLAMKTNLQASGGVAADLASGDLAIIRHAHLVGNIFVGELPFGLADKRN